MKTDLGPNGIASYADEAECFDRGEQRLVSLATWLAQSIRSGVVPNAPATVAVLDGMRRVAGEMKKLHSGDSQAGQRIAAEIDNARRLMAAYSYHAAWVDESARNVLHRIALEMAALVAEVRRYASPPQASV